jgi:hypothetical protein
MEDEDLNYDDFFKSLDLQSSEYTAGNLKTYDFNTSLGKSQYDENFNPDVQLDEKDFFNSLQSFRATEQSSLDEIGNGLIQLSNIIPEAIGGLASALDFEDYFNSNDEVGNWLSTMMNDWKDSTREEFPIYRENPGKALDFGDSAWWFDNGSSLAQSIGGFAISGGVISKSLQGLSKLTKINKLANIIAGKNNAQKIGNVTNTVTNAAMLNQAESIMEATDVYQSTYDFELDRLNKENPSNPDLPGQEDENINKAKQKASQAAEITINTNRINILLNLSSANLFLKSPKLTTNILKKRSTLDNVRRGVAEGGQESMEEIINLISGDRGRAFGRDEDYSLSGVINNLSAPETIEAALLGFVGGIGQTVATNQYMDYSKIKDPDTGESITAKEHSIRQYDKQQEQIKELDDNASKVDVNTFTNAFDSLKDKIKLKTEIEEANEQGDIAKSEELNNLTLSAQAYHAFNNGTTDHLIKLYTELGNGPQKEGMDSDYKQKAQDAVKTIKDLEKHYNFSKEYFNFKEVFLNRSMDSQFNNDITSKEAVLNDKKQILQDKIDHKLNYKRYQDLKFHPQLRPNVPPVAFTPELIINDGINKAQNIKKATSFKESIKKLTEYKDFIKEYNNLNNLKLQAEDNDKHFEKITSDKYQTNFKKDLDDKNELIKKYISEKADVDETLNSIKNATDIQSLNKIESPHKIGDNEIAEAKSSKLAELERAIAEANKNTSTESENTENENQQTESNTSEQIANNFNEGESVNVEHLDLPGKFKGVESLKVKKIKEDGSVILEDENGNTITQGSDKLKTLKNVESNNSVEGNYAPEVSTIVIKPGSANVYLQKNEPRIVITNNQPDGTKLEFVSDNALEFEREPRDKSKDAGKSLEVNIEASNPNWDIALKMYKDKDFTDIEFLIDHLPLNIKLTDETSAPIETKTKGSTTVFDKTSRQLRESIIKEIVNNKVSINDITVNITGQWNGQLQIDKNKDGFVPEHNLKDLYQFKGDTKNIKSDDFYIVDDSRRLSNGKNDFLSSNRELAKGELYIKIKMANGKPFPLKVNVKKVNDTEASLLYELYNYRIDNIDEGKSVKIDTLPNNIQSKIKDTFKKELNLFSKNKKPYASLTIKDLTDFLIWDGTKNTKSQVRFYDGKLYFGKTSVTSEELKKDNVKQDFIDYLINNKRHQIKFKPSKGEGLSALNLQNTSYLNYLLENTIINTNAVINEPTFQGKTTMYLDKRSVKIKGELSKFNENIPYVYNKYLLGNNTGLHNRLPNLNKNIVTLSDDKTHYLNSKGDKHARISDLKSTPINPSDLRLYNGSKRGDVIDNVLRDFFSTNTIDKKEFLKLGLEYLAEQNKDKDKTVLAMTDIFFNQLYNIAEQYKLSFDQKGYTIYAKSNTLTGKINNKLYAGTMDLLAYDNINKEWVIIDIKSSSIDRGEMYSDTSKDTWGYKKGDEIQQNGYKELFFQKNGVYPSKLLIIPLLTKADTSDGLVYSKIKISSKGMYLKVDDSRTIYDIKGFTKSKPVSNSQKNIADNINSQISNNDVLEDVGGTLDTSGLEMLLNIAGPLPSKKPIKPVVTTKNINVEEATTIPYVLTPDDITSFTKDLASGNAFVINIGKDRYFLTKDDMFLYKEGGSIMNPHKGFNLLTEYNSKLGPALQMDINKYKKAWNSRKNVVPLQNVNNNSLKETLTNNVPSVEESPNKIEFDYSNIDADKAKTLTKILIQNYDKYLKEMVSIRSKNLSEVNKLKETINMLVSKNIALDEIIIKCKD